MSAGASDSPVFDFTSLDFESARADLIRYAQTRFPGELWTDFNDSNPATGLVELMAYAVDLLAYTANSQVQETMVATLVREQNFRNVSKAFDYVLKSAAASSTTVRCTLAPAGVYPFTISKHLQFSTGADGTVFQPVADVAVAAYPGAGYVDVAAVQGVERFEEVLGVTNGLPSQKFILGSPDLIDGTLQFQVGLTAYTVTTNFVSAGATDKEILLSTDEFGVTTVTVGDGINGVIPPSGQTVKATYKTGGGLTTNVAAATVTRVYGTSDGSAQPAQITAVTNLATATGGASKQSIDNARQNLPLALKANERAVTLQDYSTLAVSEVTGVLKANAVAGKAYGGSSPILLFVVPNGGGNPSDALRNLTIVTLKSFRLAGKRVRVLDPVYVDVLIESDTFVQPNSSALDTANAQRAILKNEFALEAVEFGSTFALQDAYDATENEVISGVKRVLYKTFTIKPYYARHVNTPTSGNGIVQWIYTNLDTVRRREWLIQVAAPSPPVNCLRFQVKQRRIGTVTNVTDTLVTDDGASYTTNELFTGGWIFRPKPEDLSATFAITGNTGSTISTAAGLLAATEPDDPYVVEKAEAGYGKILRTTVSANVVASVTVPLTSVDSWQIGDIIHFSSLPTSYYTITNIAGLNLTLDTAVTLTAGDFADYVWQSADASVRFSVTNGSTVFVVGDELYVDTYPRTGDLVLRGENFPLLTDANLFVTPIGGVR